MNSVDSACPSEAELAAYVGGALDDVARAPIDAHLLGCSACLATVAETAKQLVHDEPERDLTQDDGRQTSSLRAPPQPLRPGLRLGRYVLGDLLGSGAMGVVYSAHDPDLDRRVAMKLVRPIGGAGERSPARLFREAQTMAKLSHPNVVAVYDVGTFEDRIFVAMELVDGRTLSAWLAEAKRPWREVLSVVLAAGRGLAAAHAVGIVHRDFKPDNVLIGRDGRVCVSDFGLARADVTDVANEDVVRFAPGSRVRHSAASASTDAGYFGGTPRYMAPERFAGAPASAASDLFGFCVTAHEALYGAHPFVGDTMPELVAAMRKDVLPPLRNKASPMVPAWVRAALREGLRAEPAARPPTMPALLRRLERDPRARLLRVVVVAALVGAAAGVTALIARPGDAPVCADGKAQLVGVWDAPRKEEVRRALLSGKKPYAAQVAARVEETLDRYAGALAAAHSSACEATRVRGEQPEAVFARRLGCLARRRQALTLLTSQLVENADDASLADTTLENAAQAARALPSIERCAQLTAAPRTPPVPEHQRAQADALALRLSTIKARYDLGQYAAALPLAQTAVREARALSHAPRLATALWWLGAVQAKAGQGKTAEETLAEAVKVALASGAEHVAARAATRLAALTLERAPKGEATEPWVRLAETLVRKGAGLAQEAQLLVVQGQLLSNRSRHGQARMVLERALKRLEDTLGPDHPNTATAASRLSTELRHLGKYVEALRLDTRAVAALERALGPEHPRLVPLLSVLARDETLLHRNDRATPHLQRALKLAQAALGPEHPQVARTLRRLCIHDRRLGQHERARAQCQRALEIWKRKKGHDADRAMTHTAIGQVLFDLGRPEALEHFRRDLEITEVHFGERHPDLPAVLANLGQVLSAHGRHDEALRHLERAAKLLRDNDAARGLVMADVETNTGDAKRLRGHAADALPHYRRAIKLIEGTLGPTNAQLAAPLTGVGQAHLSQGEHALAASALERALIVQGGADIEDADRGETTFALAQALWHLGRDQARSLALGRKAKVHYAKAAPRFRQKELRAVDGWLRWHSRRIE